MIRNLSTKKLDTYLGKPYADKQFSDIAMDCLGLVAQFDKRFANPEIYGFSLPQGLDYLKNLGYIQSDSKGNLAVMVLGRNRYHLCLIVAEFVYHSSITRQCVIRNDYLSYKHLIPYRFYI